MTSEEQAVRKWLSKPAPHSNACGCMGPQRIFSSSHECGFRDEDNFTVEAAGGSRIDMLRAIRSTFDCDLQSAVKMVNDRIFKSFEYEIQAKKFAQLARAAGADVKFMDNCVLREPDCPCAMKWYEIVDNKYYQITEHRSEDGISCTAKLVGPIGGPYIKEL